jgi:hypothetical protein
MRDEVRLPHQPVEGADLHQRGQPDDVLDQRDHRQVVDAACALQHLGLDDIAHPDAELLGQPSA